ncbi:MAG TPA: hypothetical protein VNH18_22380 [Bryobacteraceae bacterium]|nr:hypothetical protein [Bryobacteraceae bacterium]
MNDGTNQASTGPAGAGFEGQLGAASLLTTLMGAEHRALSLITVDRVGFQRISGGKPLSLYASNGRGNTARAGVQVQKAMQGCGYNTASEEGKPASI